MVELILQSIALQVSEINSSSSILCGFERRLIRDNINLRCNSNAVFICIQIYDPARNQININIVATKTSLQASHKLRVFWLITRDARDSVHLEQII